VRACLRGTAAHFIAALFTNSSTTFTTNSTLKVRAHAQQAVRVASILEIQSVQPRRCLVCRSAFFVSAAACTPAGSFLQLGAIEISRCPSGTTCKGGTWATEATGYRTQVRTRSIALRVR
jgi:hypothetical protein